MVYKIDQAIEEQCGQHTKFHSLPDSPCLLELLLSPKCAITLQSSIVVADIPVAKLSTAPMLVCPAQPENLLCVVLDLTRGLTSETHCAESAAADTSNWVVPGPAVCVRMARTATDDASSPVSSIRKLAISSTLVITNHVMHALRTNEDADKVSEYYV